MDFFLRFYKSGLFDTFIGGISLIISVISFFKIGTVQKAVAEEKKTEFLRQRKEEYLSAVDETINEIESDKTINGCIRAVSNNYAVLSELAQNSAFTYTSPHDWKNFFEVVSYIDEIRAQMQKGETPSSDFDAYAFLSELVAVRMELSRR